MQERMLKMSDFVDLMKSVLIRSIGVVMAFGFGGAGIGALSPMGWFWGAVAGVGTVFSGIIVFLGIMLIWNARLSHEDIEKAFRSAVAQQAEENPKVAEALDAVASDSPEFADFASLDDEDLK